MRRVVPLALIALLVAAVGALFSVTPTPADARVPSNTTSPTRADAIRVGAEVTRAKRALDVRRAGGGATPQELLEDARRLRAALADWKTVMERYDAAFSRDRAAGSPREAAILSPTFIRANEALTALETLGGVSGAPPVEVAQQTEAAKPLAQELLGSVVEAGVGSRLRELGLTSAVLRRKPLRALEQRLKEEVTSVLEPQIPSVAGVSALEVLSSGKPLGRTVESILQRQADLVLAQLVVGGDPLRGYVLKLIGLDKVLGTVSQKAVRIATWPPKQIARLIRGLGRLGLTLNARAARSTRGLNAFARRVECRIRPTAKTKVNGRSCKGIRHGATLAQAFSLLRQAERRIGASLRLQRDLRAAGRTALIRKHDAALDRVQRAATLIDKRYLLDTSLYADSEANVKQACAELERLDRIIAELEKKAAPPPPPPASPGLPQPSLCTSPIQVDSGVFSANINDYVVQNPAYGRSGLGDDILECPYVRADNPALRGPTTIIAYSKGTGACELGPGEPARSPGTASSRNRDFRVSIVASGQRLVSPANYLENIVKAGEAAGVGLPC